MRSSSSTRATRARRSSSEGGDWRENNQGASNDGSFGTLAGASTSTGAANTGTLLGVTNTVGSYSFTVTAGATGLLLDSFNFDARRKRSQSSSNWSVEVLSGNITTGVVDSGGLGSALGANGPTDQNDYDVDLTGLADRELAAGESATFRINLTGGNGTNTNGDQHLYMDNVAISGTAVTAAIPEPSSLSLLGIGVSALLLRRRN